MEEQSEFLREFLRGDIRGVDEVMPDDSVAKLVVGDVGPAPGSQT